MEFLNHSPFKGDKFQFMDGVVGFSLHQTPIGIGYDSISLIITNPIEDNPQARPTSVSMELERPIKIGIGKNRCHSTQMIQVIE